MSFPTAIPTYPMPALCGGSLGCAGSVTFDAVAEIHNNERGFQTMGNLVELRFFEISSILPWVIIVEQGTLKRIMEGEVQPQSETQDGYTWLATVRELAERFYGGKHHGIGILKLPLDSVA